MLDIRNLKKYYATQKAVDDVSLFVSKGTIFGLLGPNGAGKSSLLRMVTGITLPDDGQLFLDKNAFDPILHSKDIGYMPEERGLYKKMKVGEQALYLAQLKGMTKQEALNAIKYWFDKLEMHSWANKKVEDLSKGMSQKLQFVITVMHKPKLLVLDEPFSGLDPVNSEVIKNEIFELAKAGTTIIFSTHRMEQVEEICEDIALINQGKVILNGAVAKIKNQFKKNYFRLDIDDELKGFDYLVKESNRNTYILNFNSKMEEKEVLQYCINQNISIFSFHEILPSLNEIFIDLVEGKASRQFLEK